MNYFFSSMIVQLIVLLATLCVLDFFVPWTFYRPGDRTNFLLLKLVGHDGGDASIWLM